MFTIFKEEMDDGQDENEGDDGEGDLDDDEVEDVDEDERDEDRDEDRALDGDGREEHQDKPENLQRDGEDGETPNKRPRISPNIVGMRAKVLYDEGTPNEKWWTGVIVAKIDDSTYRLFFPDDEEVADVAIHDFELLEREQNTQVGRKVKVAYKAKYNRNEMWKGVVVEIVNENIFQVFFNDVQEIAEIRRELLQFY